MPTDTGNFGSAGTLVGAALETAGGFAQSHILDLVTSELGQAIAALLFVLAALSALGVISIGGKYKMAPWFLIGPGLFFFTVLWRVPANVTQWHSQDFTDQRQIVRVAVSGVSSPDVDYTVSGVFARFQAVVSGVSVALVDTITNFADTQSRSVSSLLSGTDRYRSVLNMSNDLPEHMDFLERFIAPRCSRYFTEALSLAQQSRDLNFETVDGFGIDTSNPHAQEHYNDVIVPLGEQVVVSGGSDATHIQQLAASGFFGTPAPANVNQPTFTCRDIFLLSIASLKNEAASHLNDIAARGIEPNSQGGFNAAFQRNLQTILTKFDAADGSQVCAAESATSRLAVRSLMASLHKMPPVISGLSFNNDRPLFSSAEYAFETEFSLWATGQEGYEKNKFIAFSLSLPYLQGFILYFLSATFPFFALMLVVPGRHLSVLTWASLWVWAKSWDVGFAVLMVLDKVFYYLLPSVSEMPDICTSGTLEPVQAFKTAMSSDPTYSTYIYANIMAILLTSMPVVCGFLVSRGGKFLIQRSLRGINDFAHTMGNAGSSMAATPQVLEIQADLQKERMEAARFVTDELMNNRDYLNDLLGSQAVDKAIRTLSTLGGSQSFQALGVNDLSELRAFAQTLGENADAQGMRAISGTITALSLSDDQIMRNAISVGALRLSSVPGSVTLGSEFSNPRGRVGDFDQTRWRQYLRRVFFRRDSAQGNPYINN